ncbi:MAG: ribonuclease P protein component [Chryseobacterium sp.]|nr:MAG: ribonuclease P protein component [Chryseobacterium sp.]
MKQFGYGKEEKLKRKSDIDRLFRYGKWYTCGPLRIISYEPEASEGAKTGVSVSKKFLKMAHERNRTKRVLRECYRLNKPLFHHRFGERAHSMIFWASKEQPHSYAAALKYFEKICKGNQP